MVLMRDVPASTRWRRSRTRLKKMIRLGGTPQAEWHGWWSERRGDVRPPACSMPLPQWFFRKALAATSS